MKLKIRRHIGFVLALITLPLAGYAIAWNTAFIQNLVVSSGGIGWFVGAAAVIVISLFVVFWPRKWPKSLRGGLTAIALIAAYLFGEPVRNAFLQAPWATIGIIAGVVVWLWVLYGMLVPDKFPVPKFLKSWFATAAKKARESAAAAAEKSPVVETGAKPAL